MRILVIGGTGIIGRPIVELLVKNPENEVFYISRKADRGGNPSDGELYGRCIHGQCPYEKGWA